MDGGDRCPGRRRGNRENRVLSLCAGIRATGMGTPGRQSPGGRRYRASERPGRLAGQRT